MSGAVSIGPVGPLLGLITAGALWAVWRLMAARDPRPGEGAPEAGTEDETVIPVRGLIVRGGGLFGGKARNSLTPSLSLTPHGVRFRVLVRDFWPYADLGAVDAGKTVLGAQLVFGVGGRRVLTAAVRDLDTVRLALAALPSGVKLTPRAAALRPDASRRVE